MDTMTDDTANLALEFLRNLRGDMDGLRRDLAAVKDEVGQLRTDVRERFDAIDSQLEGLRYVVVASVGSLVADVKTQEMRIATLEGARS